jgi:hypothetical protein
MKPEIASVVLKIFHTGKLGLNVPVFNPGSWGVRLYSLPRGDKLTHTLFAYRKDSFETLTVQSSDFDEAIEILGHKVRTRKLPHLRISDIDELRQFIDLMGKAVSLFDEALIDPGWLQDKRETVEKVDDVDTSVCAMLVKWSLLETKLNVTNNVEEVGIGPVADEDEIGSAPKTRRALDPRRGAPVCCN